MIALFLVAQTPNSASTHFDDCWYKRLGAFYFYIALEFPAVGLFYQALSAGGGQRAFVGATGMMPLLLLASVLLPAFVSATGMMPPLLSRPHTSFPRVATGAKASVSARRLLIVLESAAVVVTWQNFASLFSHKLKNGHRQGGKWKGTRYRNACCIFPK